MQLRDYFRILFKRGWIIILVAVISSTSAFIFSRLQTPIYRSTVMLNVWPARLDYGLQQTIQGLLRNYAGTIASRDSATEVVDRLQLDITPEQLLSKITVTPIQEDYVIQIDADDEAPDIAQQIAQTTAEVFVETIKVYMLDQDKSDRVDVSIRDSAVIGTLHKPKTKINVLAGGIFGVVVGVLVVLLIEWLQSDRIRTVADMERHAGIAVLGTVPTVASASQDHSHQRGH